MSGDKKDSTPKPGNPTKVPMQTVQPGMPGQISTLADQLSAGYGQSSPDIMAQLLQYYQPMSLPNYAPGQSPTTPGSSSGGSSNPTTRPPNGPSREEIARAMYRPGSDRGA